MTDKTRQRQKQMKYPQNLAQQCPSQDEEEGQHVEDFTDVVGHGRWQLCIIFLLTFISIPKAGNHLGFSFLAFPKDFWCVHPYTSHGTELKQMQNDTTINHCETYLTNNTGVLSVTQCESWEFAKGYKSIIEEWNLVCHDDWMISTCQSIYMIGFLVAVSVAGQMSDTYGRRPTSIFMVAVILIAGFATAFSTSFMGFVIARFFVAIGQAGLHIALYVLLFEVIGSKGRAQATLLTGCGWTIGCLLLPLLAWQLQNWRYLQLALTIPCLSYLSFYWLLPESPRWLLSRNKLKEAVEVMKNAASVNKRHVEDLKLQVKTLYDQSFKNKEMEVQKGATVLDLLRTPNLRRKTLSLYFIWMSISFIYYGLALNINDLHGDIYWNSFISGLMEIPATIISMITIDRFGRRKPFIGCLTVGGVACLGCIFTNTEYWRLTTSLALCGRLFVSAAFGFAYIYSAEIFPTVARNVGLGSSSTVGRIGSALAPFMRDLGKLTNPSVPLAFFGTLSLISGFLVVFLPETKDRPVPETLRQAEEFGKFYKEKSRDPGQDFDLKPLM